MAKEIESKKRKASVSEQDATTLKKPKSLTGGGPIPAKRKSTEDSAPVSVKKSKTPKSAGEFPAILPPKKEVSFKKSAGTNGAIKASAVEKTKNDFNGVKNMSTITAKKSAEVNLPTPIDEEEDVGQMADEEDESSDIDDQTEALLKGFESDGDDAEDQKEGGLQVGQSIPEIPKRSKKALKRAQQTEISDKPGVVYVGRIPHGFYENEMREYFEQFGKILKLRLSRNPRNGASKHYAFIQFESAGVADIVTKTMDGYLMFNHILKVQLVPDEQVHDKLFKGANKRFKKVPWNKIRGRELDLGASEATWEKRIEKEKQRRDTKAEKAKKLLGYEFDAPKIKSAKNVAKQPVEQLTIAANSENETKAIEAAPSTEEPSKSKKQKGKKNKSGKESTDILKEANDAPSINSIVEEPNTTPSIPVSKEPSKSMAKKEKKAMSVVDAETPSASVADVPKKLKTKKSKTALEEETTAGDDTGEQKKKTKKSKKIKTDS